jgi:hypothetical protein
VPAGATSISVQVRYFDAEPSNGNNNCAGRLKVGGTYYNAATHNPSGSTYTARSDNWATNPITATAWTVDDVNGVGANALQAFGFYSGDANPAIRFSCVQLQVTYTPVQYRLSQEMGVSERACRIFTERVQVGAGGSYPETGLPATLRRGFQSWQVTGPTPVEAVAALCRSETLAGYEAAPWPASTHALRGRTVASMGATPQGNQ